MKRIVVVGMGVAGSYLTRLIRDDYEVVAYDGAPRNQIGCRCGWGSSLSLLSAELRKIGLDILDYRLCKPDSAFLNGIRFPVTNGIFFDKRKMLKDMTKDIEIIPNYVNFDRVPSADYVVNATAKPLREEGSVHCVEWMMKLETPEEKTSYVWFNPKRIGYGWIFPLDNKGITFHVGAGSLYGTIEAVALTKEILRRYNFKIKKTFCGCKKKLHFGQNLPVFQDNIVSVGEAVGCVHPLTGEGILPSMRSAELLAESLGEPTFPMNYAFKVEEIIHEYREAFEALETLKCHRRYGMIKVFQVMTERLKQRTKPEVTWLDKAKALIKFLI